MNILSKFQISSRVFLAYVQFLSMYSQYTSAKHYSAYSAKTPKRIRIFWRKIFFNSYWRDATSKFTFFFFWWTIRPETNQKQGLSLLKLDNKNPCHIFQFHAEWTSNSNILVKLTKIWNHFRLWIRGPGRYSG
jgi:hypothetical protein